MKYRFLFPLAFMIKLLSAQMVDSLAIKDVDSLLQVSHELIGNLDFGKALEVNFVAEKLALEKLGRESASYGNCTFNRGRVNYFKRDYLEAEKWYLEAKAIRQIVLGKEHPDYCKCLIGIGNLYEDLGKYEKSEQFYLEAQEIIARLYGKKSYRYASNLNNLGILYKSMGKYEKAEPLLLEQNSILEKVFGKDHPDYSTSLLSVANLYSKMGLFENAEKLYLEAKAIDEKNIGINHPDYAIILLNLGILYKNMGNFVKAEEFILNSIAIDEKTIGKDHPDYAKDLMALANLYYSTGNYEKSELLNQRLKEIIQKNLGEEHPDYVSILHNLANIYAISGNFEKAEPLYLEAISIRKKILKKEHPDYSVSLSNLGLLYFDMHQYEKAEPLYLEAIAIREKVLGKGHPDYAWSLYHLANLYSSMNRNDTAELLFYEAMNQEKKNIVLALNHLSEQEMQYYINTFNSQVQEIFSRTKQIVRSPYLTQLSYDNVLFFKGFLLQSFLSSKKKIYSDSIASLKYHAKVSASRELLSEYIKPVADRYSVADLEKKANLAEKDLARSVAGYADAIRQVIWQEVQATLKESDAAIEFISFKVNFPNTSDSIVYAALVLLAGDKQPKFIALFEEKSLDTLLNSKLERKADYVNTLYTIVDRGAVIVESPKKSLYELLWKPLEKELSGIKTIYFSPSGLLHRINLDAIPLSETETLADKYQLIELGSTRQLVLPNQIENVNNVAILFGGIQFEQDSIDQINEPNIASRSRGQLSFSSVDSTLKVGSWNYLAGTEREVSAIEKMMQAASLQTCVKKGYSATEESFKNIGSNNSASPKILHIATHGYFFPDPKKSHQSSVISRQEEPVFKMSEHPMLRSGLIMAGGNAAWQGKQTLEGREDGILTAYEISQMNLSNTELVVLSACETGLGDIQGNEGVYGLQRAFKIAGAKYLIMSLWQVPDKQTSLLMITFYKNWLELKMSIPDAFHAAQKELREIGLDPYQWAGFVLVE